MSSHKNKKIGWRQYIKKLFPTTQHCMNKEIKVIEEVNYEVSNYETLIDGQYLKELIDNPSIQKIMKEIT